MIHVSEDSIMKLAEATEEQLIYTKEQVEMMNHLKTCETCFERFCSALALQEVFSDAGYAYLSDLYNMSYAKSLTNKVVKRTLAVVNLIRNEVHNDLSMILEQVRREGDAFRFSPALAMSTRGVTASKSRVYKVEDVNNEKTFIAVDSASNELLVQINTKELDGAKIQVFLETESGERAEIKLEQVGKNYKGIVRDLPEGKLQLIIVQQ